MATYQAEGLAGVQELVTDGFESFCRDISGLFDVNLTSIFQPIDGQHEELRNRFDTLCGILTIRITDNPESEFFVIFNSPAMFFLAETVAMLPEENTILARKLRTSKDDEQLHDVVSEVGNLLVTSWEKVFSEQVKLPLSLVRNRIFIGDPWDGSVEKISLAQEDSLSLPYELTVDNAAELACLVVFPQSALNLLTQDDSVPAEVPETGVSETGKSPDGPVSRTIQDMVRSIPVIPAVHAKALLAVSAKEIMHQDIVWADSQDSIQQTIEKMEQADASCILIGNPASLEGIITWIDIAEAVSIYLRPEFEKWRRPADDATLQIKAGVIMSRPVHTVTSEAPLSEILSDLNCHRLRYVVVVNEDNQVEGIISVFDIFSFLQKLDAD